MLHKSNRDPCDKCQTRERCFMENHPPCNMLMLALRDEAAEDRLLTLFGGPYRR